MSLATGCQAPPITVIGIGNPYRHDDAAGLVVLASLSQRFAAEQRIRLVELDGEPVRLIQSWERLLGADAVTRCGLVWEHAAYRVGGNGQASPGFSVRRMTPGSSGMTRPAS